MKDYPAATFIHNLRGPVAVGRLAGRRLRRPVRLALSYRLRTIFIRDGHDEDHTVCSLDYLVGYAAH